MITRDEQGSFSAHHRPEDDTVHRRHIEQALQDRETELREAERLAGVGSWRWLPGTDTLVCSEGFYRIAGREPNSSGVSYKEHQELYTPESRTRLDAAVQAALTGGTPYELDLELMRPDGSTRWVAARGEASLDKHGRVVNLRGTVHDITERKIAEQATRRLAAIVESSDDAIISKDLSGVITSWNPAAGRIFGYTPEEVIGHSILVLIPPDLHAEEDAILKRLRAGERIEHYETERLTKDGRRLPMSLTISPIRDAAGRVVGASKIGRDISERKRAEQVLLTSEKLATAGRLAATVAHEINNPLEAVINLVYLAKRATTDFTAQTYLVTAEEELGRIAHMTKVFRTCLSRSSQPKRTSEQELVCGFANRLRRNTAGVSLSAVTPDRVTVGRRYPYSCR